jgi:hypothetical protein
VTAHVFVIGRAYNFCQIDAFDPLDLRLDTAGGAKMLKSSCLRLGAEIIEIVMPSLY